VTEQPLTLVCRVCGEEKPIAVFRKDRRNPLGVRHLCKLCDRKCGRDYNQRNIEAKRHRSRRHLLRRLSGEETEECPKHMTCRTCGKEKPIDLFSKDCYKRWGIDTQCRACGVIKCRRYRRLNRELITARLRLKKATKLATEQQIEKELARGKLRAAVQAGTISKPASCSACGRSGMTIHGHHEDYSRPLEVTWLCPQCHSDRHRMAG
jgi:hypothetical protein